MPSLIELLRFTYRFVLWFGFWLCFLAPLQLLGAILLLPAIYLQGAVFTKLPRALRWFDNADQYVDRNTDTYKAVAESGIWNRYCWLAWRNPLNYFGYIYLGVLLDGLIIVKQDTPAINGRDVGDATDCVPGLYYTECTVKNKTYFEYYYIKTYTLFGQKKCFRFRMGHKLQHPQENIGKHCQFVMVISPYHSYSGVQ